MLVTAATLLHKARKGRYAVPAFNVYNLETAQAVLEAAQEARSPVILATSEGAIEYAGMDFLAAIAHVGARRLRVPVVFHLDHGTNAALVEEAIDSGYYTSVMIDGSKLPFTENIRLTKRIAVRAHKHHISVEAELGAIFGTEDKVNISKHETAFTDPEQAAKFVKATGCDSLAVSIGTAHGAYKFARSMEGTGRATLGPGGARLDINRLQRIAYLIQIPLVLHGASGVPEKLLDDAHDYCDMLKDCERLSGAQGVPEKYIKQAIQLGVAKINIDTDLRIAWTAGVRARLLEDHLVFDPRKILAPARALMKAVAKEKIVLFGSGKKV